MMSRTLLSKEVFFSLLIAVFIGFSAHAQSGGKGKIAGKVVDKSTGEAMIGAFVFIPEVPTGTAADLDGKYVINVTEGKYTVKSSALGYDTLTFKDVEVKAGQTTILNISLTEGGMVTKAVEVVANVKRASTEMMLLNQRTADVVSSGISSDYIQKTPDRTVGDALKRISGTSIQDGKFAVIRGLADRYNMAYINGAPMPSTEPDKKVFALDIIPTEVVEEVMVTKSATADMPGDFAGGFMQIKTRDIPYDNKIFVNVGTGVHSLTTGKEFFKRDVSSSTDWLGFDNGARSLPAQYSGRVGSYRDQSLRQTLADETRGFNNNFQPVGTTAPINTNFQAGISRRISVNQKDELGIIFALSNSISYRTVPTALNTGRSDDRTILYGGGFDSLQQNQYRKSVVSGAILNLSYRLGLHSKFSFKNFVSANSDDNAFLTSGRRFDIIGSQEYLKIKEYTYLYNSTQLGTSQFTGEHTVTQGGIKVNYTLGYARVFNQTPDYMRLRYRANDLTQPLENNLQSTLFMGAANPEFPGKFFAGMSEAQGSGQLNVIIPLNSLGISIPESFGKHTFKTGNMRVERSRVYEAKNFTYTYNQSRQTASFISDSVLFATPDVIYNNERVGANKIFLANNTKLSDRYEAQSKLEGGYAMMESNFGETLKMVYGMRLEQYRQKMFTGTPDGDTVNLDTTWTNWLPSINVIYSPLENIKVRGGFSKTVTRPEFREFAPLFFYDVATGFQVQGNPFLTQGEVYNYDLKIEWYPNDRSVISINPFIKRFFRPIEQMVNRSIVTFPTTYFRNPNSAFVQGVELEARSDFEWLDKRFGTNFLKNLVLGGNYTFIKSVVNTRTIDKGISTEKSNRPLQGQSPYMINLYGVYSDEDRMFDITLSYNRYGRRIFYAEEELDLFIWENPRDVIDLSVSKGFMNNILRLKVTFGDILAQKLTFYEDRNKPVQGGGITDRDGKYSSTDISRFSYSMGRTGAVSLSIRL